MDRALSYTRAEAAAGASDGVNPYYVTELTARGSGPQLETLAPTLPGKPNKCARCLRLHFGTGQRCHFCRRAATSGPARGGGERTAAEIMTQQHTDLTEARATAQQINEMERAAVAEQYGYGLSVGGWVRGIVSAVVAGRPAHPTPLFSAAAAAAGGPGYGAATPDTNCVTIIPPIVTFSLRPAPSPGKLCWFQTPPLLRSIIPWRH